MNQQIDYYIGYGGIGMGAAITSGDDVSRQELDDFTMDTLSGGGSGSSTTFYIHTDHLTGSNVVTNEEGALEQTLDYFPFGGIRLNSTAGTFDEQRKFTGQEYDEDTNFHYFIQRYYNQDVGRFTSQDPAFLAIGDANLTEIVERANRQIEDKTLEGFTGKEKDEQALQQFLSNPQQLNAYSYVTNNPLRYTDPQGELGPVALGIIGFALEVYGAAQAGIEVYETKTMFFDYPDEFTEKEKEKQKVDILLTLLSQGALKGVSETGKWIIETGSVFFDALDILDKQFNEGDTQEPREVERQTNQPQNSTQDQNDQDDDDKDRNQ